jgi:carbon-monoxide dehydrogenase small subunit
MIALTVNGDRHELDVPGFTPLATVLREALGLTGTKVACFEGFCGACVVLVDGRTVASCLLPVTLADGADVLTVEGLAAPDGALSPVQQTMLDHGGVQCGACTPGVLMTLTSLLADEPDPTEAEVREALAGNICRCTGYTAIVEAALAAAKGGP